MPTVTGFLGNYNVRGGDDGGGGGGGVGGGDFRSTLKRGKKEATYAKCSCGYAKLKG